jgi:hypothetical protein
VDREPGRYWVRGTNPFNRGRVSLAQYREDEDGFGTWLVDPPKDLRFVYVYTRREFAEDFEVVCPVELPLDRVLDRLSGGGGSLSRTAAAA